MLNLRWNHSDYTKKTGKVVRFMKPEFLKHLDAKCVLTLTGETKKAALEEIISFATTRCTLDDAQLRELIWKREKMMTTGVGGGLALPHIRVAGFPTPVIIIGLCRTPITDYKSMDEVPIQMIVFIAADERDQEAYLKLLGSVSASLKDRSVIGKIMENMNDPEAVLKLLGNE